MVTAPESSVSLTDAQTAAIEESKSILLNLETEITRAGRALNAVKNEIVNKTSEKDYLDTQITALSQEKDSKQTELDTMSADLVSANKDLEKTKKESENILTGQQIRSNEFAIREKDIVERESMLMKQEEKIESEKQNMASERAEINLVKEAFKAAITAVTWK